MVVNGRDGTVNHRLYRATTHAKVGWGGSFKRCARDAGETLESVLEEFDAPPVGRIGTVEVDEVVN